jgi:hypothetical protein
MKRLLLVLAPVLCMASPVRAELLPVGKTGWYSSFDSVTFASIPFWYGGTSKNDSGKTLNMLVGCDEVEGSGLNVRFKQRVKAVSPAQAAGVFVDASSPAQITLIANDTPFHLKALHKVGDDVLTLGAYHGLTPDQLLALVTSAYKTSNVALILPQELRLELHPANDGPPRELQSKEALTRALEACQALVKE